MSKDTSDQFFKYLVKKNLKAKRSRKSKKKGAGGKKKIRKKVQKMGKGKSVRLVGRGNIKKGAGKRKKGFGKRKKVGGKRRKVIKTKQKQTSPFLVVPGPVTQPPTVVSQVKKLAVERGALPSPLSLYKSRLGK